jgi:hypothetical protein
LRRLATSTFERLPERSQHDDGLHPVAHLALQDPPEAVRALRRCVVEKGFVGRSAAAGGNSTGAALSRAVNSISATFRAALAPRGPQRAAERFRTRQPTRSHRAILLSA